MSKKKSAAIATEAPDSSDEFVRSCWATLEGAADREAVTLISTVGAFAVEEPQRIEEAVNRLWDDFGDVNNKIAVAWMAVQDGKTHAGRRKALDELEELQLTELRDSVFTAYLLGIAVGRRLGPPAPRPGGAR